MKNTKVITTIIATFLVAIVSFVFACSKDNKQNPNTTIQTSSILSPKNDSPKTRLINAICTFNSACNAAYQENPTALISACLGNDTVAFYEITGISPDFVRTACMTADTVYQQFLISDPNHEFSNEPCESCTGTQLPQFAVFIDLSNGHLPASMDDCSFVANDFLDCHHGCTLNMFYNNIDRFLCMELCLGILDGTIEVVN